MIALVETLQPYLQTTCTGYMSVDTAHPVHLMHHIQLTAPAQTQLAIQHIEHWLEGTYLKHTSGDTASIRSQGQSDRKTVEQSMLRIAEHTRSASTAATQLQQHVGRRPKQHMHQITEPIYSRGPARHSVISSTAGSTKDVPTNPKPKAPQVSKRPSRHLNVQPTLRLPHRLPHE